MTNVTEKKCTKCGLVKEISLFANSKRNLSGKISQCKSCMSKSAREWTVLNRERFNKNHSRYRKSKEGKRKKLDINIKRYFTTLKQFKFFNNIRRVPNAIIRKRVSDELCIKYIGCTRSVFIDHLEAGFTDEMTWDNYGSFWEIDHRIPVRAVQMDDVTGLLGVYHYTNLQPLSIDNNRIKAHTHDLTSQAQANQ